MALDWGPPRRAARPRGPAAGKVYRIAWLQFGSGGPRVTLLDALYDLGYIEGKNVAFEVRPADAHPERLPALAAEVVRLNVHLIVRVAPGHSRREGRDNDDPDTHGILGRAGSRRIPVVASLSRPGGNVTGVEMLNTALEAKRLELLLEAVPKAQKIAVIVHGLPAWKGG